MPQSGLVKTMKGGGRVPGASPPFVGGWDEPNLQIRYQQQGSGKLSGLLKGIGRRASSKLKKGLGSRIRKKVGGVLKRKVGAALKKKVGATLKKRVGAALKRGVTGQLNSALGNRRVPAALKKEVNQAIRSTPVSKRAPLSDVSIKSRHDTDYYPSDAVPDNSKETIYIPVVNRSEEDLQDVGQVECHASIQICNTADGTKLASTLAAAKYGICNNFGQAIFKQVTLQEGDTDMNNSTGTYPYQCDFENCLTYDDKDLEGRPRLEGYMPDTATTVAMEEKFGGQTNAGLTARSAMFDSGKVVKVITKFHLGPLMQRRYLPPKTRITLKLIPNSDAFLLTQDATATTKTYGVYIKSIKVRVRSVKLDDQLMQQIRMNLQRGPAIYPTPIPVMVTQVIQNGLLNWEWDNIFSGRIPKILMFAIVKNAAYNGSLAENPFNYKNLGITSTRIKIDGDLVIPEIRTDFTNKDYYEAYLQVLKATNDKSCLLNSNTWDIRNIWAFDLTPKGTHTLKEYYPAKSGNLRIELNFKAATEDGPFTIIFYGLFDAISEVDALGNVKRNW
eukprot:Seg3025.2 transcript_id=Seg3025.2/GoldUCD/mRNA.D3Y31 product="putative protein F54H12.2" protein_id=Seg3025.2/GoldUCD/D3Y31